ncbi:MAG: ATP synthase F0 subunit B [Bythopirellula sp.]|nr:ATP synthase F0 subunit B [Bythopirellula sp.]
MNIRRIGFVLLFGLALLGWLAGSSVSLAQEADHAAGHGEEHAGNPNPLALDPDLAFFTLVVFGLLFLVLYKFAWPAISAALLERERMIENNIAGAALKHEEAKQMLVQYEAKLASAANEVRALMEEARRDADHTKTQILAEAKKAADAERDRALKDVERAADLAMKNIAETIANQAVLVAGKVISRNLTPEQHSQLVRDALTTLASTPSKN